MERLPVIPKKTEQKRVDRVGEEGFLLLSNPDDAWFM